MSYCNLCERHDVKAGHNCAYDTALRWKARAEAAEYKIAAVNALLKGRSSVQTVEVLCALAKEPTSG